MRTETQTPLAHLGEVPETYRHEWRHARAAAPLVLPGSVFKWYHLHREGDSVPPALDAEARRCVTDAVAAGDWGDRGVGHGLNFAVLHYSTTMANLSTAMAYLIVGVWAEHQELWEKLYTKDMREPGAFVRRERVGQDVVTLCVWELGVVCHERAAWHRYLFSARAEADKAAYLADTCHGRV